MSKDTNLFRNTKIGTLMSERLTNVISKQERRLLRLQNKRRHFGHLKFLGNFQVIRFVIFSFFFQAEDGIRDVERSRGLGDVYKRQIIYSFEFYMKFRIFILSIVFCK